MTIDGTMERRDFVSQFTLYAAVITFVSEAQRLNPVLISATHDEYSHARDHFRLLLLAICSMRM